MNNQTDENANDIPEEQGDETPKNKTKIAYIWHADTSTFEKVGEVAGFPEGITYIFTNHREFWNKGHYSICSEGVRPTPIDAGGKFGVEE